MIRCIKCNKEVNLGDNYMKIKNDSYAPIKHDYCKCKMIIKSFKKNKR